MLILFVVSISSQSGVMHTMAEDTVCHTIHMKNCTITMKKVMRPVLVKNCGARHSANCVKEDTRKCSKR
jgi:hypothetical protein